MLTADQFDALGAPIVALYQEYEDSVLVDIARRLGNMDYASAAWQAQRLSESGMLYKDILARLAVLTGKSQRELRTIFKAAGVKAMAFDDAIYKRAGLNPLPLNLSPVMLEVLRAGLEKTGAVMQNLTLTTAVSGQELFVQAADLAYMQVVHGAMSYQQAIKQAVKSVAAKGLTTIAYNGRHDQLDVATRRAVLTGIGQTTGSLQMARADELAQDLVQTSAHIGARNRGEGPMNHESWQGRIFSRSGNNKQYPDFIKVTGYGTGEGLLGWNCRHSFYPFFEGISQNAYEQATLDDYASREVTYNGQTLSFYDATQVQRGIERDIRKAKREIGMLEAAGVDAAPERAHLAAQRARMRDFVRQTGLIRQGEREQIAYIGAGSGGPPARRPETPPSRPAPSLPAPQPLAPAAPSLAPEPAPLPAAPAVSVPQPAPSPEALLAAALRKTESKRYTQRFETATLFDPSGAMIFDKDGQQYSVEFDDAEVQQMNGRILTHNHPRGWDEPESSPERAGSSFSIDDLTMAARGNMAEMRAVSPKHIHSMKPGPRGWPDWRILRETARQFHNRTMDDFGKRIMRGELTIPEANAAHFDELSRRIANYFDLIYTRTEHHDFKE